MSPVVNAFLLIYAGLFPVVNPVGGAPLFLGATRHFTAAERHVLALRVALNSLILLVGSLFFGAAVLEFFGITLPVVRIAGGLVVSVFGWTLLQGGGHVDGGPAATEGVRNPDAFYPLTMPLTVGPGSISVAITLGSQRPHGPHYLSAHYLSALALPAAGAIAGLIAISVTIFACYRSADRIGRVLGERGINVLTQLSAFIMLCIGIQIFWDGVSQLIHP